MGVNVHGRGNADPYFTPGKRFCIGVARDRGSVHSLTATELSGSHTWCLSSIMDCSCASWPPGVPTRPPPPLGVGTRVYLRVGVRACLLPGRDPPEEFGLKMSGNTGGRVASTIKLTRLSRLSQVMVFTGGVLQLCDARATPAAPYALAWCPCLGSLKPVYTERQWLIWNVSINTYIISDRLGLQPNFGMTCLFY